MLVFRKNCFFKYKVVIIFRDFTPYTPDKSNNKVNTLMELWWNDSAREKPKYSEKNMTQYNFVHHKSLMKN
jgi:hypothetical protein